MGRRADLPLHPRQAVPGGGEAHRRRGAVLHRHRGPRLLGGGARPARLRREVLHRGRQLGPGRQQPRRLLHPRRDQVPRRDPRAQARPGHLRAEAGPDLRLHVADPRVHAHAGQPVQPARHPLGLPPHAGLRREHLQVGQRRGRDQAGQVHLDAQAGRALHDRGGRGQRPGGHSRPRHQGPVRGGAPRRPPRVGAARPDDGRPRPPGAGLRPAGRHQDMARAGVPAQAGRQDGARPDAGRLLRRERADLLRHRRARRRPGLLRRQDARRPHLLLQRHPALPRGPELPAAAGQPGEERGGADQPERRPDDLRPRRARGEPGGQLRAVDHRRAARGPVPHPRRAGPGDPGPAHPQADPAHQRLPAGRPALPADGGLGARRPGQELHRPALAVPAAGPGAHGVALPAGRERPRPAGRQGPGHLARRRQAPGAAGEPGPDRGGPQAPGLPGRQPAAGRHRADHDALRPRRAAPHPVRPLPPRKEPT